MGTMILADKVIVTRCPYYVGWGGGGGGGGGLEKYLKKKK
jgi:hypothetical protein